MRNLLNPKWLFIVNTLPIIVLFFLFYGQFSIIKTLLNEENIRLWACFGLALSIFGILNFIYAVYLVVKRQYISFWYGIIAFACYVPFIYLYSYFSGDIIPLSVPRWMITGSVPLYAGTFLMPTLAYSLFILVAHFTPKNKEHSTGINFFIAVSIPVAGYLFSQIILPLWQPSDRTFNLHALLILIIVATILFLFFLVRGIFILSTKKTLAWQKYQWAWKIPIAIVLPIVGLLVNNGYLFNEFSKSDAGIFGNFTNPWFYILAIINGIFICLPGRGPKMYRLILFFGRCITFAYTLYFFLVFLPFLPLSVFVVIVVGTGFLMLAPLLLFVIHINELSKDFKYLNTLFSAKLIVGLSLTGFLVIPASITASYLNDKRVLNETLAYLYSPDYSKRYTIDKASLEKTLTVVKRHKDSNNDIIFGSRMPYLSSYFNWLVLDNLTLSDTKINYIERIFFGNNITEAAPERNPGSKVQITKITGRSTYDTIQNAWKSWVDLEMACKNSDNTLSEYATTIHLPEGCWISDYYLFVGNRKESGILAEKKSAMWVFSNIRDENKDPGILYYLTGNKVAFRVFPFTEGEVRKTGIEFIHKEPVKLNIDNNVIELGNTLETKSAVIQTEHVAYVSAEQKNTLKSITRKPYFHFLVDISKGKHKYTGDFTQRIKTALANNQPLSENAQISFVNTYTNTSQIAGNWQQEFKTQTFEGGFYLERAISTTLINAYKTKEKKYPVIVVVTDSIHNAVLDKDFSDMKFAFPESDLFFNLGSEGRLEEHSLLNNPLKKLPQKLHGCRFCQTVLQYKLPDATTEYLPDNKQPSIILKSDFFKISEAGIKEKDWQSALTMQAKWTSQILHPETSDDEWQNLVKYSFISKVMTPVTSYLVVENEAQKAILKKKQEQVLSGNKALDPGEDTQQMSEPGLWILAMLSVFILWQNQRRKQNPPAQEK
ncbi:MSEP-CTERM sorting domain-containing protein [Flavobacterium cyanobacteriorum]|uniref:MSEP-CTERM sorting domain-containing protein n=1 Tax=Flavobacterium cyanobacteriorum TaxID=2022802 RepID=A0A255Z2L3_9FLAO|nr:MSEP-CTERM sorting domain-containing protein [Flavobacterium cyanobacteriorum]OYQ35679.1 MSEP-CTERM sorting domain-containing protein [Flavobacterium cyanobacteriorum]